MVDFSDLIPAKNAAVSFDDLIPKATPPVDLDQMQRDAMPSGVDMRTIPTPTVMPDAPEATPQAATPFDGEGAGPLLARRGQQFARGATETIAALPEAAALAGLGNPNNSAQIAQDFVTQAQEQITAANERLELYPDMNAEDRSRIDAVIAQSQKQIEAYQPIVDIAVGPLTPNPSEVPLFKMGDRLRDASSEMFGAPDARDTSFWAAVAEGGGNMTGMVMTSVAAGLVGGPVAALAAGGSQGAAMNTSSMYTEALDAGADEQTARDAAKWGALIGASEIVPINRALKLLPPRLRNSIGQGFFRKFTDIAQSSGEEAAQEYLATVANNIVAQNLYDPTRGWTEGAVEGALVGAVLGGGTGAVGVAFERESPLLTDSDRSSPISNDIIGTGKDLVEGLLNPIVRPVATPTPLPTQTAEIEPEAPQQPETPVADASPIISSPIAAPPKQAVAEPAAAPDSNFEIIPEVEGEDGVETGRMVRIDRNTGKATVVEASEAETPAAEPTEDTVSDGSPPDLAAQSDIEADKFDVANLTTEQVAEITTDAATFQYKDNGDQSGVTDALRGVTGWDQRSAIGAIVYEYADGRRVIADGHQRLGLAKRLQSEGNRTPWTVEIIRETDGYSPADVRMIAALKNIRQGSGTSVDAAKVLRQSPDRLESLNLPPKLALVRDAKGLANLSDDGFGMVVNQVIKPEWGAVVGRVVTDQAAHSSIMGLLKTLEAGIKNVGQVESIVGQAMQTASTETQTDMFGAVDIVENRYLERAKILDATTSRLKLNKRVFKVLLDKSSAIEGAGNTLNQTANEKKVADASRVSDYIRAQANRKGPVSDALTAAANQLAANPKQIGKAVDAFLAAIEAGENDGRTEPDSTGVRAEGSTSKGSTQAEEVKPSTVEPTADTPEVDMFGDPVKAPTEPKIDPDADNADGGMFGNLAKDDGGKSARDKAEVDARSKQSKSGRTGGNSGDAGPMFDTDQKEISNADGRIGTNKRGNDIFEDENGVRSYVDSGIKVSESVMLHPTKGASVDKSKRRNDFLTQDERDAKTKLDDIRPDTAGSPFDMIQDLTSKAAQSVVGGVIYRIADDLGSIGLEGKGKRVIVTRQSPYSVKDIKRTDPSEAVWDAPRAVDAAMRKAFPKEMSEADAADAPKAKAPAKPAKKPIGLSPEEQARLKEINAKIADKIRNQLNSGLDPELVSLAIESATLYVKSGVRRFRDYAQNMLETTGLKLPQLSRYLRMAYNDVRDEMQSTGEPVADMDSSTDVISELARMTIEAKEADAAEAEAKPTPEVSQKPTSTADATLEDRLRTAMQGDVTLHTTKKGKELRGYVVDATVTEAKTVDPYAFKKDGGVFIRADAAEASMNADAPIAPEQSPEAKPFKETAVFTQRLIQGFVGDFARGKDFTTIISARKAVEEHTGIPYEPSMAKAVEEAVEVAVVMHARTILKISGDMTEAQIYTRMVELYASQPNLSQRTSTSIEMQAYSTPVPLAYLASRLAQIDSTSKVYEPSAGNGMLLMEADPANTQANELQESRVSGLRRVLGSEATITEGDAMDATPAAYNTLITNPPFGKVRDDVGKAKVFDLRGLGSEITSSEIDHAITAMGLSGLPDDGRAVLLIGGQKGATQEDRRKEYTKGEKRKFFKRLYDNYNVTEHFTADGSLYLKQGAGWPVDVIVINGRGQSNAPYPMKEAPALYSSWDALGERLNGKDNLDTRRFADGRGDSGTGTANTAANDGPISGGSSNADRQNDQGSGDGGLTGSTGNSGTGGNAVTGGQSGSSGNNNGIQLGTPDGTVGDAGGSVADTGKSNQAGNRNNTSRPDGSTADGVSGASVSRERVDRANEEVETSFQVQYTPRSNAQFAVGTLVPKNMQQAMSRALDDLEARVGDIDSYIGKNLDYTRDEMLGSGDKGGYFSAEQMDALALAIDNVEQGKGFIIGDQTGVGKGRFVAAMLRYASIKNMVPVFVSKDAGLYADMIRDMRDIGMPDAHTKALPTNTDLRGKNALPLSQKEGDTLTGLTNAKMVKVINTLTRTGKLPEGYDFLFTTYSQMQQVAGKDTPRMAALQAIAPNAMFVLDESHEAGGGKANERGGEEGKKPRATFIRELLNEAKGAVFSSATYAKNPAVMSLYAKTDLSLSVDKIDQLEEMITTGGVPLQQVIANMLVESGQYARRERSFDGVEMGMKELVTDKDLASRGAEVIRTLFNLDTQVMQDVREGFIQEAEGEGLAGVTDTAVGSAGMSSTNFASTMHNVASQFLLAIKVKAVIADAIEIHKQGKKPIIALSNTNGAIIKEAADEAGVVIGQGLNVPFNKILERYLDRLRRITVKDENDNKSYITLTDSQIKKFGGAEALKAFKDAQKFIVESDLGGLPGSPIDAILDGLSEAGINGDEITGRGITLRNNILASREASPAAKKRVMNLFNSGSLDALVINRSGSTGFSMHATGKEGNDGKPRHMIILQPEPNIDLFMQMLGRIHRTGQIKLPSYTIAVSDLAVEKRPAAVLMRKMASLNANTTANKKSAVSLDNVVDFLNVYGDQVVAEYLRENPMLAISLDIPIPTKKTTGGIAAKFTGRLVAQPPEDVTRIYDDIEGAYLDYIDALERMGMNTLEAKVLELDAKTLDETEVVPERDGTSPFGRSASVQTVDVKRLGKPYSPEQLKVEVENATGGLTGEKFLEGQVSKMSDLLVGVRAKMDVRLAAAEAKKLDAGTDKQKAAADATVASIEAQISGLQQRFFDVTAMMGSLTAGRAGIISLGEGESAQSFAAMSLGSDVKRMKDNPTAASNIVVRIAIADAGRELRLPISRFMGEGAYSWREVPNDASKSVTDAFKAGQSESRETRQMITGNIPAGFAQFKRGQIIIYTDNDGTLQQGVMLPSNFEAGRSMQERPVKMSSAQVSEFLLGDNFGSRVVQSDDGIVSISYNNSMFSVLVSTRGHKKYTLNKAVQRLIGEWEQRRGAKVFRKGIRTADQLIEVLEIYADNLGTQYATTIDRDSARKITGEVLPQIRNLSDDDDQGGFSKDQAAYHGTPHDFNAFSLSAIGSGEGAQAFGWGMYFAGRRGIAEHYRDVLSKGGENTIKVDGKVMLPIDAANVIRNKSTPRMASFSKDVLLYPNFLVRVAAFVEYEKSVGGKRTELELTKMMDDLSGPKSDRFRKWAKEIIAEVTGYERASSGKLFTVDVPENSDLLNWNATLEDQSDTIKAALKNLPDGILEEVNQELEDRGQNGFDSLDEMTGADLVKYLSNPGIQEVLPDEVSGSSWFDGNTSNEKHTSMYLRSIGIVGHRFLDGPSRKKGKGSHNYVIYDEAAVKVVSKDLAPGSTAIEPAIAAALMPALRAELDRMMLKNVRLGADTRGGRQGAFTVDGLGEMDILIGQSLNPEATLYHESVHAMKQMDLFTDKEWGALSAEASAKWMAKHDIEARYPNLDRDAQIEEAIAEEFGAWATGSAKQSGAIAGAFSKMKRIMQAIRNAAKGLGFQTAEDIFGKALSGEIGSRTSGNTGEALSRDQAMPRKKPATGAMQGGAFIPDRSVWNALTDNNMRLFARLGNTKKAMADQVDRARITLQDRMLPILRAQDAVERETGRKVQEANNAYLAEETFSGKVGRHLFEIDEQFTKPIIDIIGASKDGITVDSVGDWLTARHAVERNAYIASINDQMPDGGSGMTNADAQQILADAKAGPHGADLQAIGDMMDKLRERNVALRVDAGLMTQEQADLWGAQYKHYVPLKGWAETDHADAQLQVTRSGPRFNIRGQESKQALGRSSEAFNPLQAMLTQSQEVAIRAEKNRVANAMYRLAKENPAPAMWEVKTPKSKRYFNKSTGLVETRIDQPIGMIIAPNEMAVKVDGVEHRLLFNDERLARSMGSIGADQMGAALRIASGFSRYISSINTMMSPEFTVTNAFRDITAASINIRSFGKDDKNRIGKAMVRDWRKALAGAYGGMRGKADTEWQKHYAEFEKAGGKVSFWIMDQPEAGKADLEKRIGLAHGSKAKRLSRWVRPSIRDNPALKFIENANMAVDNAVRLAAFVEARKAGWTSAQAASLSKNLTVNFNRRGEAGPVMNALWTFSNASIQGNAIILKALRAKPVRRAAVGIFATSIVLDLINAALSEEDEDGELAYDKVPDFKGRRNLILNIAGGDNPITVPLPYGWSLFSYAGQQVGKVARGVKSPGDSVGDVLAASFETFSPMGSGSLLQILTPTALDPIMEMAINEDWLGRPIRPESPYNDYGPNAYKAYNGVRATSAAISDGLNRATGGSRAESGAVDVSPEYLDHAFNFIAGGAGRFVGDITDIGGKLATGRTDEIRSSAIPFAGNVGYETGAWLDTDRYYRFSDRVRSAQDAYSTHQETGAWISNDTRALVMLGQRLKLADRAMTALRKDRREMLASDRLNQAEKRSAREQFAERESRIVLGFNGAFVAEMGRQGE